MLSWGMLYFVGPFNRPPHFMYLFFFGWKMLFRTTTHIIMESSALQQILKCMILSHLFVLCENFIDCCENIAGALISLIKC